MKYVPSFERNRVYANLEGQKKQTDDSHGNDTDVNNIIARFARTGGLPPNPNQPYYGDVSSLQGDLTDIIEKGREAQKELMALQQQQRNAERKKNVENAAKVAEMETPTPPATAAGDGDS